MLHRGCVSPYRQEDKDLRCVIFLVVFVGSWRGEGPDARGWDDLLLSARMSNFISNLNIQQYRLLEICPLPLTNQPGITGTVQYST